VGREEAAGLLLLDKPGGPTSHDMVASIRKMLGIAKAGHTGTLDPLATGLLIVLTGKATRLAPYVQSDPKVYEGCMLLGLSTDSMDIEGAVTSERSYSGGHEPVLEAFSSLVGELEQVPPMYSAAKYRGKPLYSYARRGEEVARKSRIVRVHRAELRGFREVGSRAEVDFLIACSPGTYVRDLVARVGDMLACGGVLTALRRTASGPFRVEDARGLEDLKERLARGEKGLLPLETALRGLKRVEVSETALNAVRNGMPVTGDMLLNADEGILEEEGIAVFGGGCFLGMHRVTTLSPFATRAMRMM
jgi:tRNA pseudouridine55 synthase